MGQGAVRSRRSPASREVDKTRGVTSNVGTGVQMEGEGVQPAEPHGSTAGAGKDIRCFHRTWKF